MNKVIIAVVAVLVIGGGVFALTNNSNDKTPTTLSQSSNSASSDKSTAATIVYDGTAFTPSQISVKAGSKVTIKNASSEVLQLNSDPHPTHTNDPDLNVGIVAPGASKTFTVTKKGTFGYHNHIVPTQKGTIQIT